MSEVVSEDLIKVHDGTGEIPVKIDFKHDYKLGDMIKVIAITNKTVAFRPIMTEKIEEGEAYLYNKIMIS